MNSHWVLWVAHALAQKVIVRQQNHCKSVTHLTASLSYQDLVEVKRRIIGEWAALSLMASDSVLESGVSVYVLMFVLEADILRTR